jgi:hypothetical protein
MRIATRTPLGIATVGRLRLDSAVFALVACAFAAGTYTFAGRVAAQPRPVAAPALPVQKAPSAAEFAHDFLGVSNQFAREHGEAVRFSAADCVQASPGHYMCSYRIARRGRASECHVMQARWTPDAASTFTITLAGRTARCGSLREALHSLT